MTLKSDFVLLMAAFFSRSYEQNVINGIICIESTQTETFQCGYTEIIDIQSVTIAYVENTNQCTEEYMIPVIETILPPCKRSAKDSENTDGPEVYKRCHGEHICILDESVINQDHLSYTCDEVHQSYKANVLRFNYSCVTIDKSFQNVALTPLDQDKEVRGTRVELFSPYYPCYTPAGGYTLKCRVTTQKKDDHRRINVLRKLVELPPGGGDCSDYLYFRVDGIMAGPYHCNKREPDSWNNNLLVFHVVNDFEIIYSVRRVNGAGGKFWIQIQATENRAPIELAVTCEGQGNIPQTCARPPELCELP